MRSFFLFICKHYTHHRIYTLETAFSLTRISKINKLKLYPPKIIFCEFSKFFWLVRNCQYSCSIEFVKIYLSHLDIYLKFSLHTLLKEIVSVEVKSPQTSINLRQRIPLPKRWYFSERQKTNFRQDGARLIERSRFVENLPYINKKRSAYCLRRTDNG